MKDTYCSTRPLYLDSNFISSRRSKTSFQLQGKLGAGIHSYVYARPRHDERIRKY